MINDQQLKEKDSCFCEDLPEIKGFQQATLLDWEGKISSIIFLGGCNFRCGFCHSRDLVLNPEKLDSISFSDIDSFLCSKKGWIDGVEITGGEPTLYGDKLVNLIQAIKNRGFMVKLDTNGTNPALLAKLLSQSLLDYIAMDIKAPLDQNIYRSVTGIDIDLQPIIKSKDIIIGSSIDYEFRTTIIPGFISEDFVKNIAQSLMPAKRYRLQQFQPKDTLDFSFIEMKPLSEECLDEMAAIAKTYIPDTRLRK
jgi:pyruvate formate lyase activating enzyme